MALPRRTRSGEVLLTPFRAFMLLSYPLKLLWTAEDRVQKLSHLA